MFRKMKHRLLVDNLSIIVLVLLITGCMNREKGKNNSGALKDFDSATLVIKDSDTAGKVRGQVLYLPAYSNIPGPEKDQMFRMSSFVAIHNCDLGNDIKITKVSFFDNNGKLIAECLKADTVLKPLAAVNFHVAGQDKNGTGANFIVEWISGLPVTQPLIESVMVGYTSGQGVSFISPGRVIRTRR